MTQPTALFLADILEDGGKPADIAEKAAAELRRLSEIETLYLAAMRGRHAMSEELLALTAQRDALLEALKSTRAFINSVAPYGGLLERVNAAIKAVEGETE